jgi:membrane protein implicated in regulation of membrane protease activity
MKKPLGYIFAAIGLIGLAIYTVPEVAVLTALPTEFAGIPLLVISIALVVIGLFFIIRSGSSRGKQAEEVPIFKGKNVVGYRRH